MSHFWVYTSPESVKSPHFHPAKIELNAEKRKTPVTATERDRLSRICPVCWCAHVRPPLPNPAQASFYFCPWQRCVKHKLIPCPVELHSLQRLLTVGLGIRKLFLDFPAKAEGGGVYSISMVTRRRRRWRRSVLCAPC